jgi:hypothetical protein
MEVENMPELTGVMKIRAHMDCEEMLQEEEALELLSHSGESLTLLPLSLIPTMETERKRGSKARRIARVTRARHHRAR